jgi:hypothetical protein
MSKKIRWPAFKFGPVNLWSAPRQEELSDINFFRSLAQCNRDREASYRRSAERCETAVKEREFLYYLRSGRFPE